TWRRPTQEDDGRLRPRAWDRRHPGTGQPDGGETIGGRRQPEGQHEGWDILPDHRPPADHHQPADAHELVHADLPAEVGLFIDEHVAGEFCAAGDGDAAGDATVVPDVHVGHQVVVVADLRVLPFPVPPVYCDVLAERISVADAHEAPLACDPAVLGFFPED